MATHHESFSAFVDFVALVREIENREGRPYVTTLRRIFRDRINPMEEYTDSEFLSRYRFSKQAILQLLAMLPLKANTDDRGCPVPPLLQLLVTLRFYGAGTFQVVSGDLVNISQPTVSRIVERVTSMIAATLFPALVKLPDCTRAPQVMQDFYTMGGFPGVIGCIDCTHVRIKSPGGDDAEVFRNRKGYFSINVQAIAGPQLQFLDVVASWPGSAHDSRIFDNSRARTLCEDGVVPGILLGDSGYACRHYLMTPFKDPKNSGERRFNTSQKRIRNSVERVFGIWKRRFPCLDMKLQIKMTTSVLVITACAALHNLSLRLQDPIPPSIQPSPITLAPPALLPAGATVGTAAQPQPQDTQNGFRVRNRIVNQHFSSQS